MDAALPHANDPELFKQWLLDRLSVLSDVKFDPELEIVHTSYENWNVWGTLTEPSSGRRSRPTSPTLANSATRPPLAPLPVDKSSASGTEIVRRSVIARVSRHIFRTERQYQTIKQLTKSDPQAEHHVRAIQILRLQPREGREEPPLALLLMESPGSVNSLRRLLNNGPNWFTLSSVPPGCPYNPGISSDGHSPTGKIGVEKFLEFARGAAQCCAVLHENNMVHGEIRPDSFYFDADSGVVKWINHGSGIRAFENGLQSRNWTTLAQSYGINFKLQFVAPEQTGRLSAAPDQRTDIYSLGQVFYLMLTGAVPFGGLTAIETLQNVLSRRTPLVSATREGFPQALTAIISKMTQRNIEERYHSVQGLLWDLKFVTKQFDVSLVSQDASLDDFEAGSRDADCIFRVTEAQVGRAKERKQILEILEKFRQKQRQLQNVYAKKTASADMEMSPDGLQTARTLSIDGLQSSNTSERSRSNSSFQLGESNRASEVQPGNGLSTSDRYNPLERMITGDNLSGFGGPLQNTISVDFGSTAAGPTYANLYQDSPLSVNAARDMQRLGRHSRTEVVTIFGNAGLGKTTLVNSVVGETRQHGLVSLTKFESESTNPFQPMTKLMASLFRQVFMDPSRSTSSQVELEAFVRPIWSTLSSTLGLPYDLISPITAVSGLEPELERKHSSSISIASAEQNFHGHNGGGAGRCRKATAFLRSGTASKSSRLQAIFVSVLRFLSKYQPILFVLEDVECADAESLELLLSIVHARTMLTIIFTCRSHDDISPSISRVLNNPAAKSTSIELSPLSEEETAEVVGATLHRSREYCFPLAAVALHRTQGNPFALKTFLEECHKKQFIWYSLEEQNWNYDFEKSFEHFAAPNMRHSDDFILERLLDLPSSSKSFLAFACFLGSPFRFSLVKTLMQAQIEDPSIRKKVRSDLMPDFVRRSSQDAVKGLEALIAASVLRETEEDDFFEFCHSRYRVAAKRLKECGRTDVMNFQIAKVLIQDSYDGEDVFTKAKYICAAIKHIKANIARRKPYRTVLLEAAGRCTESDSKSTALQYLSSALALLQEDPWTDDNVDAFYTETLLLHIRAAQAFVGDYAKSATTLLETTIRHAKTVFDKVPAYLLLSRLEVQGGKTHEAIQTLKIALSELGVEVHDTTWAKSDIEFTHLRGQMDELDQAEFIESLPSDDTSLAAIGEVMAEALSSAFWASPLVTYQLSIIFAQSTLTQGITNHSGLALVNYASGAVGRWDLVTLGVKLSIMADGHFRRFEDDYATGRGLGVNAAQIGWLHRHLRVLVPQCDLAMERSLNANDRNMALMNGGLGATMRLWSSWDFADIENFTIYVSELAAWETDRRGGILLTAATQYARAFQGKTQIGNAETIFTDSSHDTETYLEWAMANTTTPIRVKSVYAQFLVPALYVFGYHDAAIEIAEKDLLPTLDGFFASRTRASILFFLSMSYLASFSNDKEEERISFAKSTLGKLTKWSEVSDINLMAWTSLISAALQERNVELNQAVRTYEAALDHCEIHGFTFELGMVYEHYAEFLIRRGANRVARSALGDAAAAFKRISCHGKAAHIAKKHEWLLKGTTSLNVADAACQTSGAVEARPNSANVAAQDAEHDTFNTLPEKGNSSDSPPVGKDDADLNTLGLDVVDVSNILQSSQVLASTLQIDELLSKMADIMRVSSGAELAAITIKQDNNDWSVAAVSDTSGRVYPTGDSLEKIDDMVGKYITMYGIRFRETVFVESTASDYRFSDMARDSHTDKSVFTAPIIHGTEVIGSIYVENAPYSFTQRSLTVLRSLLSSVSISIANANLFKKLEKANAKNNIMIGAQREALSQARDAEAKAKEAQEEALENLKQKEEAAKAKSLFLANTSHELRTPLNGVIGMSELLKSSKLAPDQESYCDSIRVCADTLLQVINDILDFSKLEAGKLQLYSIPVSLRETIVEVVRALSFSNREKQVETITELAFLDSLVVTSDPVRLHQVLMNILSNAYKFTPEGSVTVKGIVKEETDTEIEIVISVADTGIGIDESARKKLFMPFSQADNGTSRAYGGTGLGLSICKAIVENAMDGKIWLDSQKGVGTTVSFQLRLPKAVKGRGGSSDNVPRADPMKIFTPDERHDRELGSPLIDISSMPRDEIRIAIAEDNMLNQKIALKYVAKLGFPLCEAFNDGAACVEGLDKANDEGRPFAIVLMDCQMPRMDGYDATRLIRKHKSAAIRNVIIIAMTASAIRGDREKCLEAGMSAYLAKPVKQDMLKRMIDSYIGPETPISINTTMNGSTKENGGAVPIDAAHIDA